MDKQVSLITLQLILQVTNNTTHDAHEEHQIVFLIISSKGIYYKDYIKFSILPFSLNTLSKVKCTHYAFNVG